MSKSLARLRIVAINDVYDLANLPRLQTFLAQLNPKPSAVTLAGDFLSPSTLSSIDGGRGMAATLRATGLTHISLGNHEQDLRLEVLYDRLKDLSKSANILNTNLRENLPPSANWMHSTTHPYSLISSPCRRVNVALLGLLSDEPGMFRDNTFKGIPIANVIESYQDQYRKLVIPGHADICIPLTHSSMARDRELARAMLEIQDEHSGDQQESGKNLDQSLGIIIGGHEHEAYDEIVSGVENDNHSDTGNINASNSGIVRIFKSGMDANAASVIDLTFTVERTCNDDPGRSVNSAQEVKHEKSSSRCKLIDVDYELVEMKNYEPSIVVQSIVDKHQSVLKDLDEETIIDTSATSNALLPPGALLSSEGTRFQQTTVGGVFCQMIKEEREVDAVVINGATIKGGIAYPDGKISYAQLKKELPFPTKLVVVPMERHVLDHAISYSRTSIEDGVDPELEFIPRRGYLQVDLDYDQPQLFGSPNDVLKVALPRNLLNGFCKIEPLMEVGNFMKANGTFPGSDDFVPAIETIVRHACKNRWSQIIEDLNDFADYDLNGDGQLDREEIRAMMTQHLGHDPPDFVVEDMIAAIDEDKNGVIDKGEFSFLMAQVERYRGRFDQS